MQIKRLFNKLPAGYSQIQMKSDAVPVLPGDIYRYAVAYRDVYTYSMRLLKKVESTSIITTNHEMQQLNGNAQAIATQIALSNELLLKAILLGSTLKFPRIHDLKKLIKKLDDRYVEIIRSHLEKNGLKNNKWESVLKYSDRIFIVARYGFNEKNYIIDFMTLQLLNEALEYIFCNKLPDWDSLREVEQNNRKRLKEEVDKVFDEKYQKEQLSLRRAINKLIAERYK